MRAVLIRYAGALVHSALIMVPRPDSLQVSPSPAERSDEALMEAFRDGDAAAFEVLYRRHKGPVYRYLLRQCRNAGEAEELFQDVWMNLVRAKARYTVEARFTTYIYALAHNRFIDHVRRKPALSEVPLDDGGEDAAPIDVPAPESGQPEVQYQRRERVERFRKALAGLPPPQREAYLLHEESDLSLEDIARVTGSNRETVKSRLRYALDKLRAALGPEAEKSR
jgi:RNA polymerase sigma-70 factor (ECF subfamily)